MKEVGIFIGKAYKCYNKRIKKIIESANVKGDYLSRKFEGISISEP